MVQTTVVFYMAGGSIPAGENDKKKVLKFLGKKEYAIQVEKGHIIEMDDTKIDDSEDVMTLEEMLDAPKATLTSSQLSEVCESYGLDEGGKKAEKLQRIEDFENMLAQELNTLLDEDLAKVAAYFGVNPELDRNDMIDAIEEVSE